MRQIRKIGEQIQSVISLHVNPRHGTKGTVIGSAISSQAGAVVHGFNYTDYLLPGGDRLRLLANHNMFNVQILLLSNDSEKIKRLPGHRHSSLVANLIAHVNRYLLRSNSYFARTKEQRHKYQIAQRCIESLTDLLAWERQIREDDWVAQEQLRIEVIRLIEENRSKNSLLANHPLISEGELGINLYEARQLAQHHEFNRLYPVSRIDQLDFSEVNQQQHFIWDSEIQIGNNQELLDDSLRAICEIYDLERPKSLSHIPANRFERVAVFFRKLWRGGSDWIDHLKLNEKPTHSKNVDKSIDGVATITIEPFYCFEGLEQKEYDSLENMLMDFLKVPIQQVQCTSIQEAEVFLRGQANGSWYHDEVEKRLLIRHQNRLIRLRYYYEHHAYIPLPHGEDLYVISQLSKRHLYFLERFGLEFKAFFSRIPRFFVYFFVSIYEFIKHDIYNAFRNHIEDNHKPHDPDPPVAPAETELSDNLYEILVNKKLMSNGQSLQEFIQLQLAQSNYIIAREEHLPSLVAYNNPFHRTLNILRHFGGFFVNTSEKNPIIGMLAMFAYAYGAGAVIAPEALKAILTKLHLHGLISGIEPTQALGSWMSHGMTSEAISAAITYWQATIIVGDLDQFFIKAIDVLQEDAAAVAIILSLAIGLGNGVCKAIPALGKEMGRFPYVNYAAFGFKFGAAFFDTVMNPGEDWLIGTIKWALRAVVLTAKILVAPVIEGIRYGYETGFKSGLNKSSLLLVKTIRETGAALLDIVLLISTIPLLELSAMFIHVPFRGMVGLISKSLGAIGRLQPIGQTLMDFVKWRKGWNYLASFRFSPLYGFNGGYNPVNIVWQVSKNLLILPMLDLLFISIRLTLSLLNLVVRAIAYLIGSILIRIAPFWDKYAGAVLITLADAITTSANWLDNTTDYGKQHIISGIQVWRRAIFDWAFSEQEQAIKSYLVNDNCAYFYEKPVRLMRLPNESHHFLAHALSSPASRQSLGAKEMQHFSPLFAQSLAQQLETLEESSSCTLE